MFYVTCPIPNYYSRGVLYKKRKKLTDTDYYTALPSKKGENEIYT